MLLNEAVARLRFPEYDQKVVFEVQKVVEKCKAKETDPRFL